jgi:hypothetical protein
MLKGSELRSKAEQAELKRLLAEFTEKIETDPYQPGIVHPKLCSDDLQDVVDDVLFIRGHSEMTVKIKKDLADGHVSIEVVNRILDK